MTAPIPATIEEAVSPQWLSQAIAERFEGTRVTEVRKVEIVHAVAARAAIEVRYAGTHAGRLPGRLFVKGGFAPDTIHLLAGGAYYREARFYRELAPALDVGTPLCLYAGYDEDSRQGIVVLENLPASGANLYRLGDTHSVALAGAFVGTLAKLHARAHRLLQDGDALQWVPGTQEVVPRLIKNDPLALLSAHLAGERGAILPDTMRDPQRILSGLKALMASGTDEPAFLLHGDMHLGNIFTDADGRPGWYDWQTLQIGCWAMDAVYYIVGSLTPEDRARSGAALLEHYASELAQAGGPRISAQDTTELYQTHIAYGLFIWSVAREIIVPLPVLKRLLARFAAAAVDAETFAALSVNH